MGCTSLSYACLSPASVNSIISNFQISDIKLDGVSGKDGLLLWYKRQVGGGAADAGADGNGRPQGDSFSRDCGPGIKL